MQDVLIGHSMGGWIAYHIKHLIGCPIIHIASLTSIDRIKYPVINHPVIYYIIRKGIAFNPVTVWIASLGFYHHQYSKDIFMYYARLLEHGNRENIVNQFKTIVNPVSAVITVQPDLRIHSKDDNILGPPKEPYYSVPGDHFNLYTYPDQVAVPVNQFLATLR